MSRSIITKPKPLSSLYGASLLYLVEMDRRLAFRGLVLSDFARHCKVTRSTAGRYLRWIVLFAGLPTTCRWNGETFSGVEAIDWRGRGRRTWKYADGCAGLFTPQARRQVRAAILRGE